MNRKSAKKRQKSVPVAQSKAGSVELENKRHEIFCRLYAGVHGMNFFGNGARCYMHAFGYNEEIVALRQKMSDIAEKREKGFTTKVQMVLLRIKAKEKIATVEASGLLAKPNVSDRVDFLMENMFDDNFADRELGFVMGQRYDLPSKVSAIRHYDDKKGRIVKHIDLTTGGDPIDKIEIVAPSPVVRK